MSGAGVIPIVRIVPAVSPPLYIDTEVSHITWRGPCACMVKPYPCFRVSKDASASSITTRNPLFSSATAAAAPPMPAQNAQTQHTRDCRRWRLHYTHTHAHTHTHSVPGSTRFSVRKPPDQCLHRHGPTTLTNRAFASTRLRSVVIYAARKAVTASTDTYLHQRAQWYHTRPSRGSPAPDLPPGCCPPARACAAAAGS